MKKIVLLLLSLGFFSSCGDKNAKKNDETTQLHSEEITSEQTVEQQYLLGIKKRSDLEAAPYASWFSPNYKEYQVNQDIAKQLKPLLQDVTLKVFMGTWCSDSQQQTPPFYKILDAVDYNEEKLTLITVSRAKTTPDKHEKGFDIKKVPTFIFYKNGKELNRIVEYPIESLEKDMLAILSGKPYKHAYEE